MSHVVFLLTDIEGASGCAPGEAANGEAFHLRRGERCDSAQTTTELKVQGFEIRQSGDEGFIHRNCEQGASMPVAMPCGVMASVRRRDAPWR